MSVVFFYPCVWLSSLIYMVEKNEELELTNITE